MLCVLKKRMGISLTLLAFLLLSAFTLSCGVLVELLEENFRPKEDKFKIALSKFENAEYSEAIELFEKLIEEEGEKREYLMGLALARMSKTLSEAPRKLRDIIRNISTLASPHLTDMNIRDINAIYIKQEDEFTQEQDEKPKGFVSSFIEDSIRRIILDGFEIALPLYEKALKEIDETFVLDVKGVPIAFEENRVYFVGKFGEVEARFLYSIIQFIRAFLYLILSINLDAGVQDISKAVNYVNENGGWYNFFSDFFVFGAPVLVWVLNRNTAVLTNPYKRYLRSAKEFIIQGAEENIKSFEIFKKKIEEGDKRKGFIGWFDEDYNVQILIRTKDEERVITILRWEIYKYAEDVNNVLQHLKYGDPPDVPCMSIVGTLVAIGGYVFGLYTLAAGAEVGKEVPEITQAIGGLSNTLTSLQDFMTMCGVMRINLHSISDNINIRSFIPVWTYISDNIGDDNFWFETECGVDFTNFMEKRDIMDPVYPNYCKSKEVELEDSSHFTSPITIGAGIYEVAGHPVTQPAGDCEWDTEARKRYCIDLYGGMNPLAGKGIPADGAPTRVSYYLWQDPSFGKSIMFDMSMIRNENVREMIRKCGVEPEGLYMPQGTTGVCVFNIIGRLSFFEK